MRFSKKSNCSLVGSAPTAGRLTRQLLTKQAVKANRISQVLAESRQILLDMMRFVQRLFSHFDAFSQG
jgi:hypothetical protein